MDNKSLLVSNDIINSSYLYKLLSSELIYNNSINITNQSRNEIPYSNSENNDTNILNSTINTLKENNNNITNSKSDKISNYTNNEQENIKSQIIDNIKNIDKKYLIGIEILLPLIVLILVIIFIIYRFKKKNKLLVQENNNNLDNNGLKFQNSANNTPYNRIQNTSGFNVGLNPNNFSMSEIKVQNLKDEIHNIITNNSGGSNSSGKRKREKRKIGNNKVDFSSQDNNKGIQNEIKEEIKQYVIDEHQSNN